MLSGAGGPLGLAEADVIRVLDTLSLGFAPDTLQTYGAGLLVFHVFCDLRGIAEADRAPVSTSLLLVFMSAVVGSYTETAVNNFISGLHAWHLIHGLPWSVERDSVRVALRAANALAPSSRGRRAPLTVDMLLRLRAAFDLSLPLDAAVWAALLTVFWCTARRGEFVLPTLSSFDPRRHIKRSDYRVELRDGVPVHVFALPHTKTKGFEGEDVFFVAHPGLCDPLSAIEAHFALNDPPADGPLFAYWFSGKLRPLTASAMQKRIKSASAQAGVPLLSGHSARIGSLLWHLLNGMPFREAMAKGRWVSSSSFHLYLRCHAQVLSPHLHASPALQLELNRRVLDA